MFPKGKVPQKGHMIPTGWNNNISSNTTIIRMTFFPTVSKAMEEE